MANSKKNTSSLDSPVQHSSHSTKAALSAFSTSLVYELLNCMSTTIWRTCTKRQLPHLMQSVGRMFSFAEAKCTMKAFSYLCIETLLTLTFTSRSFWMEKDFSFEQWDLRKVAEHVKEEQKEAVAKVLRNLKPYGKRRQRLSITHTLRLFMMQGQHCSISRLR